MQGDPLEVCRSNPYEKWWGSHRGSNVSGRGWKRSCSEYILEMEPPAFTFGMWGIKMQGAKYHFLKISLNNWSVSSNLPKWDSLQEAQAFWGESGVWGVALGMRCLIEEDVSSRQVRT